MARRRSPQAPQVRPPTEAIARTGAASQVTESSATIAGAVTATGLPAGFYFEYGPTKRYGGVTPEGNADPSGGEVSAALSELQPSTLYHYRLVVGSYVGVDRTFRTKARQVVVAPVPIILPGAIGGVAGSVPGSAAGAASMAAGVGGVAALATVATNATGAVIAVLGRLSRRRLQAMRERMLAKGVAIGDVDRALADEAAREIVYQRRADDRVKAGMKLALQSSDASTRATAVEAVMRREQLFAQMRASVSAERVLASAELEELRRISPKGGFWMLGKRKTHTPDCLAMAGHFWPWSVLAEVHPLLHPGCGCYLISLGAAIARGLMAPGDIPTDAAARKQAAGVIAHVRQEKVESARLHGLEEQATRELVIREAIADAGLGNRDLLACAPLRCDAELIAAFKSEPAAPSS